MTAKVTALTDVDRDLIARARELADLKDADAFREHTGVGELSMAHACVLGEAQELLWQLARLAERLGVELATAGAAAAPPR